MNFEFDRNVVSRLPRSECQKYTSLTYILNTLSESVESIIKKDIYFARWVRRKPASLCAISTTSSPISTPSSTEPSTLMPHPVHSEMPVPKNAKIVIHDLFHINYLTQVHPETPVFNHVGLYEQPNGDLLRPCSETC